MNNKFINIITAVCLCLQCAPALFAQDLEKEIQRPADQTAVQAETAKTAAEAEAKALTEAKDITYEQILEKPDDPDLNLAYAKAQVRRGDLKGAAGTLERMLMVNPDLHAIRLFYAVVLLRLDNLAETRRELDALKKGRAPWPSRPKPKPTSGR